MVKELLIFPIIQRTVNTRTAIYGYFLTSTQLPMVLADYAVNLPVPPMAVIGAIILICFGLGCVMGTLPLVFITVPIFAPVVVV